MVVGRENAWDATLSELRVLFHSTSINLCVPYLINFKKSHVIIIEFGKAFKSIISAHRGKNESLEEGKKQRKNEMSGNAEMEINKYVFV